MASTPKSKVSVSHRVGRALASAVFSALAMLGIQANLSVIGGSELSSSLAINLSKLAHSCASGGFRDVLIFVGIYLLLLWVGKRSPRLDIATAVLAVFFSVSYVVCVSFRDYSGFQVLAFNRYQTLLSTVAITGYAIVFYVMLRSVWIVAKTCDGVEGGALGGIAGFIERHLWLVGAALIFVCWLPWMVGNYPCSYSYDAERQLFMYFGQIPITTHHPPLSTLLIGGLVQLGQFVGDANLGVFLYVLLNAVVGALVFSRVMVCAHRLGWGVAPCLCGVLYFALVPVWGAFLQWLEKDLIYVELATLHVVLLVEMLHGEEVSRRRLTEFFLVGLLTCLLRNNGVYVVVPSVMVLAFAMRGRVRLSLVGSAALTLALYICLQSLVFPALGIAAGSKAEMLSVPFQQTARYVTYYGDEVTEEEHAAIDAILEYDRLAASYNPKNADFVKYTFRHVEDQYGPYLAAWVQMFLKHPGVYISAFIDINMGYLAPVKPDIEAIVSYDLDEELNAMGIHRVLDPRMVELLDQVKNVSLGLPGLCYLVMPGFYTWLVLACLLFVLKAHGWRELVVFVPALLNLAICLAAPLSFSIRYMLPVLAMSPLLMAVTWHALRASESSNG